MHGSRSIDVAVGDVTTTGSSNIINTGVFLGQEDHATKLEKCRDALFLSDPEIDRARLISEKGKRVDGTCEWIREDEAYNTWRSGETNLLWINGGPGKGKTILSIFLTQEFERDVETIYYFCINDDPERNNAAAVLRGLIWQVTAKRPELADGLLERLSGEKTTQVTLTSPETLWCMFVKMLNRIGRTYCVLDGLDECDEDSQRWLVTKLVELMSVDGSESSNHVFKIAIISRPEVSGLSECAQVRLDPDNDEQVGKDIRTFVSSRVQKLASGVSLSAELHLSVQTELFKRSEGTFLWVGFAMVELLKKKTATEIQRALYSLPKGLPGIYGRMVRHIEEEHRHKSLLILRWITLAFRPLSLLELATAVGTQPPPHVTLTQAVSDQISMCGPLVKVEGKTASLVHQSARDYLLRDKRDDDEVLEWFRIKPNESHTDLAVACVDCLVQSSNQYRKIQEMEPDTELRDAFLAETQEQFPLREYAVEHWPDHAKASSMVETILQRNGRFFVEESPAREVWWQEYSWISWRLPVRSRLPALHVASRLGIPQWAQKLIAKRKKQPLNFLRSRNHVNQRDSDGRTPLWWAAYSGHEAVVRLLLATGKVDANLADFRGETALLAAADAGHEAVVRLLLAASEVDVNPADTYGRTALWFAASRGQEAMVQLLLATGKVDANASISDGGTPLHIAAENGQEAVVQLLLATDKVDVNAQDHFNRTPLSVAAENGQEAVVQLLLATDKVDVDAKDIDGRTPLSYALAEGHKEVVQLLQEHSRRHYKSEEE